MKINFNESFEVYVDGGHIPDVTAFQITLDRNSTEMEHNKISLYYNKNGGERVLSVGLEVVEFVQS